MPGIDVSGRALGLRQADLSKLFTPRRVAVIGASDSPGRPNTNIWRSLVAWGQRIGAEVLPVNPTKTSVDGHACVADIAGVPGDIDLAVILIADVESALRSVVDAAIPFAIAFGAGFAELGGEGTKAQQRLADLLAGTSTRLLGPNTNLNAFDQVRTDLPAPKIALITQSGHQGRPIFQGQEIGIAVSHWAPTGNEVDLEFADFACWFADRPEVGAIAAYIEGFRDGRTMLLAADHAAGAGVPIVCVKVGRTDAGAAMASSHTGKLTGGDKVVDAAFGQSGVIRVDGLDELLDTAQLLARCPTPAPLPGPPGVVVYAISGGTGAHMADLCSAAGLHLPVLSDELQGQLHEWIPPYLHVANPVDNGGHPVGDERGRKILDALVADPAVDVIICPITGAFPPASDRLARDLAAVAETTTKPICVVWGSPVGTESAYRDVLLGSQRLAVFRTFGNCVTAVRAWAHWHEWRRSYRSPFLDAPTVASPAAATARALISEHADLAEAEAKAVLAAYGIPVTADLVVTSACAALDAARQVGRGSPVVLKATGPALAHKSDVGGVRLGLVDDAEIRQAYEELVVLSGGPVLVSGQVTDGVLEVVVGVSRDPVFGPTVMVGLGGVLVELTHDVSLRVAPFGVDQARAMIDDLAGRALFDGYRGRAAPDVDALVDVIMKVQRLAMELSDVVDEIDINPLILRRAGAGAIAVDALVVPARPR